MREIKFRAWTGQTMLYQEKQFLGSFIRRVVMQVTIDIGAEEMEHESYLPKGKRIDDYLMQFTGLHDAYKQEIYEGDVLAYDQNFRDQIAGYVEWRCNRWDIKTSTGTIELTGGASPYCVVGNIHEQPELLTRSS